MAAHGWGKERPVEEWLYEEPYRFDFFQAVKLLEMSAESPAPVGEGAEPAREAVRFKSAVGLSFAPSDVADVRPPERAGRAAEMTVNFMGLAGATGPLHTPSTELIIERAWQKDTALRDFLDIFNHRLVSLLYRTRKLHRVGMENAPPGEDRIASYLYSAAGLGTPNLRGRMRVKDRALLFYSGLLGQQPRSMAGLETLLSDYFGVEVQGSQFSGRWVALEDEQHTRIGSRGAQNNALGSEATVGTRVWDQQGAFELRLGPLKLEQFLDFLPTGWAFGPLCDLVRFYVGDELDFSFRLKLAASEIPSAWLGQPGGARLGATEGARLGWTSLLSTRWNRDISEVAVSPSSSRAFAGSVSIPYLGLPPDKLSELVERMTVRSYEPGRLVIRQGEAGHTMYVVRKGSVSLVRRDDDGRDVYLGTVGPGEYFGELALITSKARQASAVTLSECELLELRREDLNEFAAKYPRFDAALRAYAETRLKKGQG